MIVTTVRSTASAATVHDLLIDVDAWSVWSPHVASVDARERRLHDGWHGRTRACFSPVATRMTVDVVRPDGGYTWHATVGPWRLDHDNAVIGDTRGGSSVITFTARLTGPANDALELVVAPLSALGQRRRMTRLARLAELLERRTG